MQVGLNAVVMHGTYTTLRTQIYQKPQANQRLEVSGSNYFQCSLISLANTSLAFNNLT